MVGFHANDDGKPSEPVCTRSLSSLYRVSSCGSLTGGHLRTSVKRFSTCSRWYVCCVTVLRSYPLSLLTSWFAGRRGRDAPAHAAGTDTPELSNSSVLLFRLRCRYWASGSTALSGLFGNQHDLHATVSTPNSNSADGGVASASVFIVLLHIFLIAHRLFC
jgi:hypothetical protein